MTGTGARDPCQLVFVNPMNDKTLVAYAVFVRLLLAKELSTDLTSKGVKFGCLLNNKATMPVIVGAVKLFPVALT